MADPEEDLPAAAERDYNRRHFECPGCGEPYDDEDAEMCEDCQERQEAEAEDDALAEIVAEERDPMKNLKGGL